MLDGNNILIEGYRNLVNISKNNPFISNMGNLTSAPEFLSTASEEDTAEIRKLRRQCKLLLWSRI